MVPPSILRPHRSHARQSSSAASASKPCYVRCSTPCSPGTARSCSSAAKPVSARRRWSSGWRERPPDQGCLVLRGGCYDLTTTPPYGPWAEALRDYERQRNDDQPPLPTFVGNLETSNALGGRRSCLTPRATSSPILLPSSPSCSFWRTCIGQTEPASTSCARLLAGSTTGRSCS